jgi:ribosomal protein S18 acetylase RimI-like enzyme
MADFKIAVSEPDSAMFGFPCVRANAISKANIPEALDFARRKGARVLIARCDTGDIETARSLENEGFRLADTLVFSRAELQEMQMPAPHLALPIRCFRPADTEQIVAVARVIYGDYVGHYHADPLFDRAKVKEGYADWARRSCVDKSVAAEIFAAHDGERIAGFVTMRLNDAEDGEMVVGGVHPDYAGKGIYRDFLIAGMKWCIAQGRIRMVVSTQVNNYAVQRAWAQLGFKQYRSQYTFHRWFPA